MNIALIKRMMDACYQAKRVRDLLPALPDGVLPFGDSSPDRGAKKCPCLSCQVTHHCAAMAESSSRTSGVSASSSSSRRWA